MITQDELKSRLHYDPETGIFTYLVTVAQMLAGSVAGRPNTNGHIQISINNKRYLAHHLAWLYMTGVLPVGFIVDHENRTRNDNRWLNLREANYTNNQQNRNINTNNSTGFKGVTYKKSNGKYAAQITINGKRKHLGYEDTPEKAYSLYLKASSEYFGEFSGICS